MSKNILYILIMLIIIAYSCANELPPTGGPKDIEPPKVIKSIPENNCTNFNNDKIVISFDEYFKLNNITQKLIISPNLNLSPEFIEKGKNLIIKFKETLQENTTYTLFFDDAIVDFNEGNALNNFKYTFSTGNNIDSLNITGKLINSFSTEPVSGALIGLYEDLSDSAFNTKKPIYATKTLNDGSFRFENLKDTKYNIHALVDMNNNRYYDLITEEIAFINTPISVSNSPHVILKSFVQLDSTVRLISQNTSHSNAAILVFDKALSKPSFKFYGRTPSEYITKINNNKDTIFFFSKGLDTINMAILDNNVLIDSIRLIINSDRLKSRTKLTLNIPPSNYYKTDLKIKLNTPIDEILCDSVRIVKLNDSIVDTVYHRFKAEKMGITLTLDNKFEKGNTYSILVNDSSIKDINGKYNARYEQNVTIYGEEKYGNLVLKVKSAKDITIKEDTIEAIMPHTENYILQLIDSNKIIIRDTIFNLAENDSTFIFFNKLSEGDYSVVLIYDINADGFWTSGSYSNKLQAERVERLSMVRIKENWTIEEVLNIK